MSGEPGNVLDRFDKWARTTPTAIAVVADDETLTYSALADRANSVAALLRSSGIVPGDPIGVFMDRRAGLLAVLLGIWKAGGAYVPFDPADPPARVARLLDACATTAVIVDDRGHRALFGVGVSGPGSPKLLPVTRLAEFLHTAGSLDTLPQSSAHHDDRHAVRQGGVAYLLFTSGTTGDPKAVAIEHRSVANLLSAAEELFGFSATDRYLAASTIAFDISVAELFLPLVTGGSLLLRDRTCVLDPRRLATDVRRHNVTVVQTGPSVWQALLHEAPDFPRVRVLVSTGEAVSPELAIRLRSYGDQVWNMYGPTETTVWATAHRLDTEQSDPAQNVELSTISAPIGRAISGLEAAVVDDECCPVADGERGELAIGGVGVALGYVGNDEYTAARFVQFAGREGRWYLTGDVVVRDAKGVLHYYGRNDDQLKIRGIRVEPSEVEAELQKNARVAQAAATWFETAVGTRSIVAAVVLKDGATCSPVEMHASLEPLLPSALIPSRFVFVERIPMTPSGKVDRRAIRLAATESDGVTRPATFELTDTEQELAAIWKRLLQIEAVAPEDHFFTIGGDSLGAVQMIVEAESALGIDLPVQIVFEAPTLRRLAAAIDAHRNQPYPMTNNDFVFPLVEGEGRPIFFCGADLVVARRGTWTAPCGVFVVSNWARGVGFVEAGSVEALARTHVSGIRRVQPTGPYRLAGYSLGGLVAIEIARQLQAENEEIELLFLLEPMHPFHFVGASGRRSWPSELPPLSDRLGRRVRRLAQGPNGVSPKRWLEEVFPYERVTWPVIQWTVYKLVHTYGRHPNPVALRLLPHDRWPGFWYAAKRMVREYEPEISMVRTLAVFGRRGFLASEVWEELLGPEATLEVVDASHDEQFTPAAMAVWMQSLTRWLEDGHG
jgi:enterobactin synthetase component F